MPMVDWWNLTYDATGYDVGFGWSDCEGGHSKCHIAPFTILEVQQRATDGPQIVST